MRYLFRMLSTGSSMEQALDKCRQERCKSNSLPEVSLGVVKIKSPKRLGWC